jgi:hypothetical protein
MAGTIVADTIQADSTSTLVLKNGVANTPPTIQDSAGTQIGTFCRAWVNFNGTGTVAIRASFNVSSITDNGTGDYTVNFTNALPDANYAAMGCYQFDQSGASASGVWLQLYRSAQTTSAVRVTSSIGSGLTYDGTTVTVAVFR